MEALRSWPALCFALNRVVVLATRNSVHSTLESIEANGSVEKPDQTTMEKLKRLVNKQDDCMEHVGQPKFSRLCLLTSGKDKTKLEVVILGDVLTQTWRTILSFRATQS